MAETKREIERKYEAPVAGEGFGLPDLSRVAGVFAVIDKGVVDLDAVYYDTADQRLAAAAITLRRRTGGADAGWHLKLPISLAEGVRDEIRAPLSDDVPRDLTGLVRSRVREADLVPLMRLRSSRDVRDLTGADGALLAEVSIDGVRAERLTGGAGTTAWTEIEVELADGGDPAFLGKVEKKLRKAGVSRSASASKLARALTETGIGPRPPRPAAEPETPADHVLAYLRAQRDAIVDLDPAVRRDLPDSVHQMRVATRRLRSALRSYRKILDRAVTDPIGDELKWIAAELGADRDQEVLTERLTAALDELPRELSTGPVRTRLRTWSRARRSGSRRHLIAVLDGKRYLALLAALDALVDEPPLRAKQSKNALAKAVLRDYKRLAGRVDEALAEDPGPARDRALHDARKAAKRARYAAELAAPALGDRAKAVGKHAKAIQSLLGEHQDSVMAREALRDLAAQAHAAGESAFTYGLLYGREEARAERAEAELPPLWAKAVSWPR
ncbi:MULTISPECIES: CHAD domain-containing protein [unclassified Streptomyces]|uniref:CYTH and CHAD domain-containing protein n=1 Tax=unclassified Streptomyces TaxID=2593676 RepID=UPI0036F0EB6C